MYRKESKIYKCKNKLWYLKKKQNSNNNEHIYLDKPGIVVGTQKNL